MIEYRGTHIYFAGDTAYWHHFERIAHEFPSIDIALMPIGPCLPRDWMKVTHVDAAEAVQSFIDLRARHFIPMHWGTFGFGLDGFDTPLNLLQETWQTRHAELSSQTLHLPKIGQSVMPIAPQETHIIQPPVDIQIQL
jgi:L-ascorbate metabolism protein UlaG (beta-lactamase superfamily)